MIIVEVILFAYATYVVIYTTIFTVAAHFYRSPLLPETDRHVRFCVLIPCYKEDAVIESTVRAALHQSYPQNCFDVTVIADKLRPATVESLRRLPIRVMEVAFEISTKVKALNAALERIDGSYDYTLILDADNHMEFDFLNKMNRLIQAKGYMAVQGQRKPKNSETTLAFLDGISEAINNFVYRQGSSSLRLSASINGSGFAIGHALLRDKLRTMHSVGGFDRELEALLVKDGVSVYYYRDAVVLDEKVSDTGNFRRQRRRWIASQYEYLRKYFKTGMLGLFCGDLALFNTAILRDIQLPRLLNIGLLFVFCIAGWLLRSALYLPYSWWFALCALLAAATFSAVPKACYTPRLAHALIQLPLIFLHMVSLLFQMRGANRRFLHTPHHYNQLHANRNVK